MKQNFGVCILQKQPFFWAGLENDSSFHSVLGCVKNGFQGQNNILSHHQNVSDAFSMNVDYKQLFQAAELRKDVLGVGKVCDIWSSIN